MNKPQIIKSPGGEELVVLPLADYEFLVRTSEDAEDIRAANKVFAGIAAGEEELVPLKVVQRILAGENRIRVWREHRGMKVGELASAANISHAYLSQIESGKRDGTASTMQAIAKALGVDMEDILPPLAE